jgi:hypothetical protein
MLAVFMALGGCGQSVRSPARKSETSHRAAGTLSCSSQRRNIVCRVLFIGNSFTYTNDLPAMLEALARSRGRHVLARELAWANATLAEHLASSSTASALASVEWNDVVLQEQSKIPAVESLRLADMAPPARQLVRMIRASGATPLLFLTWAHLRGWPEQSLFGYASMQAALDRGYQAASRELHTRIVPVGDAWWDAYRRPESYVLFRRDLFHPTVAGTYLAACVFFASVFRENPQGLSYRAGLPPGEASHLQAIAAEATSGA